MTKDKALTLAAEMERGQFSTTLLPAAAELRRLHEETRKLMAQQALDRKAENARELGLDYEPENTLHWHALNYRTAPTQNAQAMFEALERFVAQPEQEQQIETLKRCLFQMQEAAKDLVKQAKSLPSPQRTWVGLDSEEIRKAKHHMVEGAYQYSFKQGAEWAEAKLKEKNK